MFRGHHRQVRILFGVSDILLIGVAFQLAYATRIRLELTHEFFITSPIQGLLMGRSRMPHRTASGSPVSSRIRRSRYPSQSRLIPCVHWLSCREFFAST